MSRGIRIHKREISTAIRRSQLSGTFVIGKYRLAPYMACEHGCIYCDGRAERYWVEGDFDRDIVARTNLPERVEAEVGRLRERGIITIGSGITDPYQPVEQELRLTSRCAEVLAAAGRPVTVLTKSASILRDIDLWAEVNRHSRFTLAVSLVHADEKVRSWVEPGASSVRERLAVLREFKDAGCSTGVLAMPLLPGLHDHGDHLRSLFDLCKEAGVDFVMPGGLTLRPGRQKEYFFTRLREHRPDLVPLYHEIFEIERPSGIPSRSWTNELHALTREALAEVGLPGLVPHRLYKDLLEPYDELQVLLHQMVEVYGERGAPVERLHSSIKRLLAWIGRERPAFSRHRSWEFSELSDRLFAPGRLEEVLQNDRLSRFVREHVGAGTKTFDAVDGPSS